MGLKKNCGSDVCWTYLSFHEESGHLHNFYILGSPGILATILDQVILEGGLTRSGKKRDHIFFVN